MISNQEQHGAANKPVAVVAGASSGIGQATAIRLAAAGYDVAIVGYRNLAGLQRTAAGVLDQGGECRCVGWDIGGERPVCGLVDSLFAWRGRVDAWVQLAGADVLTGTAAGWSFERKLEQLYRVDLRGCMLVTRLVADRMFRQPPGDRLPCILTTGWDQAESGMEGESGQYFSAIKAAVAAFSKSLAKSYAPRVRVNCLCPGWIQTAWGETSASAAWHRRAQQESCLGRWGRPEDVAETAMWLVSPAAEFINGQSLAINGGWRPPAVGGTAS
jgi:3-oxoacyl-[acyl-carrier protein] reductase